MPKSFSTNIWQPLRYLFLYFLAKKRVCIGLERECGGGTERACPPPPAPARQKKRKKKNEIEVQLGMKGGWAEARGAKRKQRRREKERGDEGRTRQGLKLRELWHGAPRCAPARTTPGKSSFSRTPLLPSIIAICFQRNRSCRTLHPPPAPAPNRLALPNPF